MAYIKCLSKCTGGEDCRCNGAIHHELHLCHDKTCVCHTARRYGVELVLDGAGREYYVPTGARLVRKVREVTA